MQPTFSVSKLLKLDIGSPTVTNSNFFYREGAKTGGLIANKILSALSRLQYKVQFTTYDSCPARITNDETLSYLP